MEGLRRAPGEELGGPGGQAAGPDAEWAADELVQANQETRTVFYPFGGPDLLTPLLLFPNADTYVLLGLEFVGQLPNFEKAAPENIQAYFDDWASPSRIS